jgi:hypothetical protein
MTIVYPNFFPQEMPVPWYLETQLFLQPELRQQRQGGGAEGIAGLRREPLKAERSPKSGSGTL